MIADMKIADIVGEYKEATLQLYGSIARKIYYTEIETPFPDGKLIVSTTDLDGVITNVNRSFIEMSGYSETSCSVRRIPYSGIPICRPPRSRAYGIRWRRREMAGYVKNLRKDGGYYWVKATVIPNVRGDRVVGYTSVRRKPSRSKVAECIELYPTLF